MSPMPKLLPDFYNSFGARVWGAEPQPSKAGRARAGAPDARHHPGESSYDQLASGDLVVHGFPLGGLSPCSRMQRFNASASALG